MLWTKPLAWFLVGSSGLPLSAPVTSECIPYRDVRYPFPNAGLDIPAPRTKRHYIQDIYAQRNDSMREDTYANVQQFANELSEDLLKMNSSERLWYSNLKWSIYAANKETAVKFVKKDKDNAVKILEKDEDYAVKILEKEKMDLERYARRVAVPTQLWHNAKLFAPTYLTSVDEAMKIMGDINDKICSTLNPAVRNAYLKNCTIHFGSYVSNPQKIDSDFPKTFNRLQAISPKLEYNKNDLTPLQHGIVKLYEAEDVTTAKHIWMQDKDSIWKLMSTAQFSDSDLDEIRSLSLLSPLTVREQLNSPAFKKMIHSEGEEEYALDAYLLGRIFRQRSLPKWYKQCMWVLYDSKNPEIRKLKSEIEEEWSDKPRERRYDIYCEQFNTLYNLLSEFDKHGLGEGPPKNCEPTADDFEKYIKRLKEGGKKQVAFVAKTLCSGKLKQDKSKKGSTSTTS